MTGRGAVRPAATAGVVLLLLSLVLVALAARSDRTETVRPQTRPLPASAPPASPASQVPDGGATTSPGKIDTAPAQVGVLLGALAIAILVMLALFLWVVVERLRMSSGFLRRYRDLPPVRLAEEGEGERADPAVLAAAVEAGLRELEEGAAGEGVVACWVQLERAAEEAGAGRSAPETPSELAGRLIDSHGVGSAPLVRLAELYRVARYSAHPVPESARTEARSLLEAVRADLALASATFAVRGRRP